MTTCIILTSRQAATVHTSAIVNYHGALQMAGFFASLPALARQFYAEAADWRKVGEQIEEQNPGMEPHNWTS